MKVYDDEVNICASEWHTEPLQLYLISGAFAKEQVFDFFSKATPTKCFTERLHYADERLILMSLY